jgi:hypothetical protein
MAQGLNHKPIINKPNKKIINKNIKREQKTGMPREDPGAFLIFIG